MPDIIQLVKTNCRDCHCCIRYCPTKAIRYSGHQANIIGNMCVLCGECYRVCPHDAKSIVDGKEITKVLIQQSEGPVIASIDPAFPAFFGVGLSSITEGLKAIGFTGVEETAIGAAIVKKHYDLLISESDDDVIISTTCPSVVSLVEKYYPELIPYLAPVVSPMVAHAQDIKRRMPDAKIVHIGGCIARKQEQFDTEVDSVSLPWGAVPSTIATPRSGKTTPSRESGSPEQRIYSARFPDASTSAATCRISVDFPHPGPPFRI